MNDKATFWPCGQSWFPSEPDNKLDPKDFPVQKDKLHKTTAEELGPGACGLLLPAVPASAVFKPSKNWDAAESFHKKNPIGKKCELFEETSKSKDELTTKEDGEI